MTHVVTHGFAHHELPSAQLPALTDPPQRSGENSGNGRETNQGKDK